MTLREGWFSAHELAGPRLAEALELVGRSLGAERADIRGQGLVELVSWYLAAPAAAALLAGDRLPDVGGARVWIGGAPPDGVGAQLGRAVHTDAPLERLRQDLLAHLTPLVEAVNAATRRPRKALWRGAADRVAGAFVWFGEQRGAPERGVELARAALAGEPPLRGRVRTRIVDGRPLHLREGCCLYYRIPGCPTCPGCPLRSL